MFRPAALYIGLRYTRAKRRNHFISFISVASMLGIALGMTVLITVLSVMNGFDREIQKRVFSMIPPINISSVTGYVAGWQDLQKIVQNFPYVKGSAPFATGEVLLNYGGAVQAAMISGILPEQEKNVTEVADKMVKGQLDNLKSKGYGIVLGENLASMLQARIGDKITVITPQVVISPVGVFPQSRRFTVVGIFRAGSGFGFDRGLAFVHLNDAQKLLGLSNNVTGLHLSIHNPFMAPQIASELMTQLTSANITTWADQFGEFFHAIQLEKKMMFFILLLIIAVATFNLVSTLIMVVSEKEADIAILRTFGATPRMIMAIFIVQGGLIGIFGTLLGLIGGLTLAANVTEIVNWIEHVFHVQFLSSSVYFVNYLPSHIELTDVIGISFASLFLSLLATIYPAYRAAKMDPVESLRYE